MTMKTVGEALMRYVLDNGTAPDIEEIGELRKLSHPALRRLTSLSDGWGNDLHYLRDEDDEATFYIASAGRDGKFDGWEQEGRYQIIKLDHYNRDVIYSNGGFIYISTQ